MAKLGKILTSTVIGKMVAPKNMAKYYENARRLLLCAKPRLTRNVIDNNPDSREAKEFAHEVCKLAEKWAYDGRDENGHDWENNYPF